MNAYKDTMMKRIRHIAFGFVVVALTLLIGALPASTAAASPAKNATEFGNILQNQPSWQAQRPNTVQSLYAQNQSQRKVSASRAKSAAMSRHRGARFINVQLVNQSTYRVRLQQKNGRIVDVYVDAYTGRVKN